MDRPIKLGGGVDRDMIMGYTVNLK
jgi:hypothetical protein